MKVPFNWLKEYVNIRVTPKILADKLTMAGLEVTSLEMGHDDAVFEIEVTANRADCLSVLGIAQEVVAVLGTSFKHRRPKQGVKIQKDKTTRLSPNFISIKDKKGCCFYRGCLLTNITVGPSPAWLKKRIEAVGIRPINNIVDITNYCLFEFGQPLHAFDYDKLIGGIVVRRAQRKEKILTIDEVERELGQDMLVISDTKRVVAVAGVMGDKLSEVGALTKNILLESAYFDPILIRRASRSLGVSTESSYRFERGVDAERVTQAQDKAIALMVEFAGARLVDMQTRGNLPAQKKCHISFHCQRANEFLSLELTRSKIKRMFESLGFRARNSKNNTLLVNIPSFRRDLSREEDLIEECARIYGYSKIPSTMPAIRSRPIDNNIAERMKKPVRAILCALGFDEIITYSLIGKDMLEEGEVSEALRLLNPLSSEQQYLRSTLAHSVLRCLAYNMNRANKNVRFFEISHVFNAAYQESMSLAILATGARIDDWKVKQEMDFFAIKGTIESLIHRLGVREVRFSPLNEQGIFLFHESAQIQCQDKTVGVLGRIDNSLLLRFGIKHAPAVFYAEIFLNQLCVCRKSAYHFSPLSVYPSVVRDMSLIVKESIRYEEIVRTIQTAGGHFLKQIILVDLYRGKQIPAGRMSITVSLAFAREDCTLSDNEISSTMERIRRSLKTDLSIEVRS